MSYASTTVLSTYELDTAGTYCFKMLFIYLKGLLISPILELHNISPGRQYFCYNPVTQLQLLRVCPKSPKALGYLQNNGNCAYSSNKNLLHQYQIYILLLCAKYILVLNCD